MNSIAQVDLATEYFKSQGCSDTFYKRFWQRIEKSDACWIWNAGKSEGYGVLGKGPHGSGYFRAHVVSWIIHFGPVPLGKCVLHHCDNRACVRPDHLWIGTRADNIIDAKNKGRNATGENHGRSKLKKEQVEEIRSRYIRGTRWTKTSNTRQLCQEFNVSETSIYNIVKRHIWI